MPDNYSTTHARLTLELEAFAMCREAEARQVGMRRRQEGRARAEHSKQAHAVQLTRGYRRGELPDIEHTSVVDFVKPLRASFTRDEPDPCNWNSGSTCIEALLYAGSSLSQNLSGAVLSAVGPYHGHWAGKYLCQSACSKSRRAVVSWHTRSIARSLCEVML